MQPRYNVKGIQIILTPVTLSLSKLCNVSSSSEMSRINMFYSLTRPGRYPRNLRIVRIVAGLL